MTLRRLFVMVCFTQLLLGDNAHPAHFSRVENSPRDPSLIVSGVHLLSGQYAEVVEDMRMHFALPLATERTFETPTPDSREYLEGNLSGGWNWNWKSSITFHTKHKDHHHRHLETTYDGPHGTKLFFDVRKHGRGKEDPHLFAQQRKGETNRRSWYISGQNNTHNLSLLFNKDRTQAILRNGAGDEKIFCAPNKKGSYHTYRVDREELASGLTLKYAHSGSEMSRICVLGQNGQELSHVSIRYATPIYEITESTGRSATYVFCRHKFKDHPEQEATKKYALEQVLRPNLPDIHYAYVLHDKYLRGRLSRIGYPEGRYSAFNYYNRGKVTIPGSSKEIKISGDDFRVGRIQRILAPLGPNGEIGEVASFRYERIDKKDFSEKGITTVFDARGKQIAYEHEDLQLKTIHFWGPHNGAVAMRERFIYSKEEDKEGDLLVRYVEDAAGRILLAREFFYDDRHNVIEEKLWGNITGNSFGPREITPKAVVHSTGDCQHSFFCYSNDGRNLVLWEKRGDLEVDYTYYPHSSLLAKKVERDARGLARISSYEYDNTAHVSREILEDESGFRVEKRIRNNNLGLPEEIEVVGLKKELNTYDAKGLLIEKRIVDASGALLSSNAFTYDGKENCIYERNTLGQEVFRAYDANKNLVYEKGPDPRVERHLRYDLMNRLVEVKELRPEGDRSTYYRYNCLSQRVHETDFRGHQKEFHFDWWECPSATVFPAVATSDGMIVHGAFEEHNALGHLISKIAPDATKTVIEPTILGEPVRIIHQDGSEERFGYSLFGHKLFHVEKGGLRHEYSYDAFGRITSEKLFDENGVFLSEVSKRYSGLLLKEEVDSYGVTTTYSYDAFGRLSEKRRRELFERNEYDALGRLLCQRTPLVTKRFVYDPLGRILEEKSFLPGGSLQEWTEYSYDDLGNPCRVVSHLEENKLLVTETSYDSFGRVTHKKQGSQEIHVQYLDDFMNEFGQRVEKKIITAADGIVTEIEKDPLGRDVLFVKRGLLGEMLQKKRSRYDGLARLTKTEETVYFQGVEEKTIVNTFAYNCDGNLIESIEAVGTPERKIFRHDYCKGRKSKTIKPDGIELHFTYDAMGKMRHLTSSDNTIHYEYGYDGLTRLVEVIDHIAGTVLKRSYDQEEQLLEERFPDYAMNYSYDFAGRLSQVSFFGGSWKYCYEGTNLSKIVRHRSQDDYEIAFSQYDLAGCLKEQQLLGAGGAVSYSYDSEGTFTGFSHPRVSDAILSFDAAKRPLQYLRTIEGQETLSAIRYDSLGQITEEGGRKVLFDSLFNPREQEGKSYSYNSVNERSDLRYDFNGNLLELDGMFFRYDALDRLIAVEKNGITTTYTYDGLHRRLTAGNKQFLYQGECEIGSMTNGQVDELRLIHSANFGEVGSTAAIEIGDRPYSTLNDSFGHIVALIDAQGHLADSAPFSPFGKDIAKEGLHPWRFSSKRIDPETGLVFFGQRYYSIELMRWLTPDPLSLKDGSNLYAYVHNNPLTHVDAFGLFAEKGGWLDGWLRTICSFPGSCLEMMGRHCLPIPLVREVIECTGWLLQGKRYQDWIPSFRRDHSCVGTREGSPEYSGSALFVINGINTTFEEFKERLNEMQKMFPGVPILYAYNGSKGFITDVIEAGMDMLGIHSPSVMPATELIEGYFQANSNGGICATPHSQGCIQFSNIGKMLDPDIIKKIDVHAFGPGKLIDPEGFKSATNYVSSKDFVPLVDFKGFWPSRFSKRSDLVILPSKADEFFDHSFSGPTYGQAVRESIRTFLQGTK